MATELAGKTIAFLATEGVEQVELTEPWKAVEQAGGKPELVSLEGGEVQAFNHLDKGDTFTVDKTVGEATAADYDGLVLPGGVANPDFLRADEDAVGFVRAFFEQEKPVGVICHGPWTLVEADVLKGRTITSWPSLEDRHRERGRHLGRRGGPRRRRPDELAQPGRPAGVLREDRRGVRRGQARRAGRSAWSMATAILDIDGTLVDTNYHHAVAWYRAFRAHGFVLPLCASTGTSGWAAISWSPPCREGFDREHGDEVRARRGPLRAADRRGQPLTGARADRGPQGRGTR